MNNSTKSILNTSFKKEIIEGLSSYPKYLSSKYFYDKAGDKLFRDIMNLPEYYLTNCEFEIISIHTIAIAELFQEEETGFDLIELGAGDGKKTKILLKYLSENNYNFVYKPIDISANAVEKLSEDLANELPSITVDAEIGEYFQVLDRLQSFNSRKKVIMLLGSNIGNLLHPRAIEFLTKLRESIGNEDLLFIGFDQKKDPMVILDAYNDKTGITAAFNKNILTRINTEFNANFNIEKFRHWEKYDPETGTAKSFLLATEAQTVTVKDLNITVTFDKWETIHTEISQKYDDRVVSWLAKESGLEIETSFTDSKQYYKNYVFRKKNHNF